MHIFIMMCPKEFILTPGKSIEALAETIYMIQEIVGHSHGKGLYSLSVELRDDRSRIMLKTFTSGRAEICFVNASTLDNCIEVLSAFLDTTNNVGVKWIEDKYYKE